MKTKLFYTILLCIFLGSNVGAQKQGKVRFYTSPPIGKTIIKIGDSLIIKDQSQRIVQLDEGVHRVQFWASDYNYTDTIVTIIADSTIKYKKLLYFSEAFKTQRAALNRYSRARLVYRLPDYGAIAFAATGIGIYGLTLNYKSRYNKLDEQYQKSVSQSEILQLNKDLDDLKSQTIKRRNISYALFGTAALLKTYGYFMRKKFKRKYPNRPQYRPPTPPFDLGFKDIDGVNNLALTIKF